METPSLEKSIINHTLNADCRPVLYSFRRCPYAMRGRMGLYAAKITVEFREIILRNKPAHMVAISPKATVPVLQLANGDVIDESLDIMLWALEQNDTDGLLADNGDVLSKMKREIEKTDTTFKRHLDRYKYPNRYPGDDSIENREAGLSYLKEWEQRLSTYANLYADKVLLADIAIFPFVRQFANVDRDWFDALPIPNLQRWLDNHLSSKIFSAVMTKQPLWKPNDPVTVFPFQ